MASKEDVLKFEEIIEDIVWELDINYIDAILHYCEEKSIEPEVVTSMIGRSLKTKIAEDAERLNFLPRTAKLPI